MTAKHLSTLRSLAALTGLVAATLPASAAVPTAATIIPLPLNPVIPAVQRECAVRSSSGVGTRPLKPGAAEKPAASDTVLVNYIGYLAADGTVFDQGMRAAFPVDGVIKGFAEGLQTMGRGAIARICVPAALGYAEKATGPIPPNSDLVFQVELVDFKTAAQVQAMRQDAERAEPAPQ